MLAKHDVGVLADVLLTDGTLATVLTTAIPATLAFGRDGHARADA